MSRKPPRALRELISFVKKPPNEYLLETFQEETEPVMVELSADELAAMRAHVTIAARAPSTS